MDEVVVTGAGIVSPIALGVDAFWDALLGGRHGFTAIPDSADLPGSGYWAAVPDAYLTQPNLPPRAYFHQSYQPRRHANHARNLS
jgi:3-oxoacyl-(acyl-carrier-protein) synthase